MQSRALSVYIIAEAAVKCKEEFHDFFMKRYVLAQSTNSRFIVCSN